MVSKMLVVTRRKGVERSGKGGKGDKVYGGRR